MSVTIPRAPSEPSSVVMVADRPVRRAVSAPNTRSPDPAPHTPPPGAGPAQDPPLTAALLQLPRERDRRPPPAPAAPHQAVPGSGGHGEALPQRPGDADPPPGPPLGEPLRPATVHGEHD